MLLADPKATITAAAQPAASTSRAAVCSLILDHEDCDYMNHRFPENRVNGQLPEICFRH